MKQCARPLQVQPPQPKPAVDIDALETLPFNPSPEVKKFQEFPEETPPPQLMKLRLGLWKIVLLDSRVMGLVWMVAALICSIQQR